MRAPLPRAMALPRARWADLRDSSTETLAEPAAPLAPTTPAAMAASSLLVANSFDSYTETPEWDLADNPRGALSLQLERAAALGRPAAMLLQSQLQPHLGVQPQPQPQLQATGTGGALFAAFGGAGAHFGPSIAPASSWEPNVKAPEFVPTAAVPPPALMCAPGAHGAPAAHRTTAVAMPPPPAWPGGASGGPCGSGREAKRAWLGQAAAAPVLPLTTAAGGWPPQSPAAAGLTRRRLAGKRSPSALWSAGKRPKGASEARFIARVGEDSPTGGQPAPGAGPFGCSPRATRPVPEASEEDWQRRTEKRQAAVVAVKMSPEYLAYAATRHQQGHVLAAPVPGTPDPNDRAVSKRHWEEEVRQWRTALRQWGPENGQAPCME